MTRPRRWTKYKAFQLDEAATFDYDGDGEQCYTLLRSQAVALAALAEYQRWETRWRKPVQPQGIRDQWVTDVVKRLFAEDDCAPATDEDSSCNSISPFHPAISYYPNYPRTLVTAPHGPYTENCWTTGAGYPFADGNDAMINPLCYASSDLAPMLTYGLPSFTVHFSGSGVVRLDFVPPSVPAGAVWLFPDGNPLLGALIDLDFREVPTSYRSVVCSRSWTGRWVV